MDDKVKECFKPHVLMHALFGLGLGGLLTSVVSGLRHWWVGVIVMVVAVVLDLVRVM